MKERTLFLSMILMLILISTALYGETGRENLKTPCDTMFSSAVVKPAADIQAFSFSLKQVRLLPGPFRDAMERDLNYLLSLDSERLLHTFLLNAGLPTAAKPLGGWEKPEGELRGHTLGHYLSACAFMFAATEDLRIKARADAIVAELAECQRALGTNGYLSAFPEEFFDRVESMRKVWAPYYTLHKIMAGLVDWYEYGEDRRALGIVEKMAGWVKMRTDRSDDRHMERVLNFTEQGGMNEVLANLYSITGKKQYLDLARRFDEMHYVEPLVRSQDQLTGEHVNSFIPNIIGSAREFELTGDPRLRHVARFFWSQVTGARSYVTGGTSNHERWQTAPRVMATELGTNSQETCCTYNMLKLTRHLFNWDAAPDAADYYERALWNGILSTQNPADGMMMYHVSMKPGMYKTFMVPEDSFWCCTGTGMENHAKYGDSIYFHDDEGIYLNLFIASELEWPEKGLVLRQETDFPEGQETTISLALEKPTTFSLHLRIPGWIEKGGYLKLNGSRINTFSSPGSFLTVSRTWKTGDRVELFLPMGLSLERLPDDPKIAAVLYGPIVLASPLGTTGLTREKIENQYAPTGDPVPVPRLQAQGRDPADWIDPVPGKPLTFRTHGVGTPEDVILIPFYKLFGERYTIYWELEPKPREEGGGPTE